MKKIIVFLLCTILFSSCSITPGQFLSAQPATFSPVPVFVNNTSTEIPSPTLTVPTPTYTVTPTLVGLKTVTRTPNFTPTLVTETPLFLITPNTATPSVQMEGFVSVVVSGTAFYKTAGCEPISVKFTAQAGDPVNVAFVVLFVRFKSKQSGATSEWTSIPTQNLGAGTFTHDLISEEMKGVDAFKNAWIQYQFVATNAKTREIGRTAIFSESLTLLDCEPPTPTPSLIPTPTLLKP